MNGDVQADEDCTLERRISVNVNGADYVRSVPVRMLLSDFLRHELCLTGTHVGCEHGVCGACTVIVDDRSCRSCLMLAVQADKRAVLTIEGLGSESGELGALQMAFQENHGLQCGFCTPGILMTLVEFLKSNPDPTDAEIGVALSGNLCRCTGYQGIMNAVKAAALRLREEAQGR